MAYHFPERGENSALWCAQVPPRYPAVSVTLSVKSQAPENGIKPNGINTPPDF